MQPRLYRSLTLVAAAALLFGVLVALHHPASAGTLPASTARAVELSDAFADVAERISPAVVSVKVEVERPQGSFFGLPFSQGTPGIQRGGGSGVIVKSDGAIVTNHHVVDGARRIEVVLKDGRSLPARVLGVDPATDLALLDVEAEGLPTAVFADSDAARVGDWVVAIGSPFGLDYTLTAGVLSAKGRGGLGQNEIEDYLQTDASINPGNSGGPLVTLGGEVLGINTMIIGKGTGIGFAIPANMARHVTEQILEHGSVRRAWIGIGFQELTPELASSFGSKPRRGALVADVAASGPAQKAGVQPGDIVTAVDGEPIRESRDLLRAVLRRGVGQRLQLSLLRDGKTRKLSLTTGERPGDRRARAETPDAPKAGPAAQQRLGLALSELGPALARRMGYEGRGRVVVEGVRPGGPGERAGLRAGDVILRADNKPVETPEDVVSAMHDGRALLRVERGAGAFFTILEAERGRGG